MCFHGFIPYFILVLNNIPFSWYRSSQVTTVVKNPPANAGDKRDKGSIHELGRSLGVGNGNQLQDSCLESPMDRGTCRLQSIGLQRVGYHCLFLINLCCFWVLAPMKKAAIISVCKFSCGHKFLFTWVMSRSRITGLYHK